MPVTWEKFVTVTGTLKELPGHTDAPEAEVIGASLPVKITGNPINQLTISHWIYIRIFILIGLKRFMIYEAIALIF